MLLDSQNRNVGKRLKIFKVEKNLFIYLFSVFSFESFLLVVWLSQSVDAAGL